MREKDLRKLIAEGQNVDISDTISVSLCWATEGFSGLRWCVVHAHQHRFPKWKFWKKPYDTVDMYGPFPSRNQAVKFAKYLANPV